MALFDPSSGWIGQLAALPAASHATPGQGDRQSRLELGLSREAWPSGLRLQS